MNQAYEKFPEKQKGTDERQIAAPQRHGNLRCLFKAYYGNYDRYNGTTMDNFDRKFCLFNERCDQSGNSKMTDKEFYIMLFGAAQKFLSLYLQRKIYVMR